MAAEIRYNILVGRSANNFSVSASYYIEPYYSPVTGLTYSRTDWSFTQRAENGAVLDFSFGSGGAKTTAHDTFAFDQGPGVEITRLTFEAENSFDGYGFGFGWFVFDGALEDRDLTLNGSNDTDIMFGGRGDDLIRGYAEDDWIDGGAGADRMYGGSGSDTYVVAQPGDRAIEAVADGTDTVRSSVSFTLRANVEDLDLTGARDIDGFGNALRNTLYGNDGDNRLAGGAAGDLLFGEEGADTFVYRRLSDSTVAGGGRDLIDGFRRPDGDLVDLRRLDADITVGGDQTFDFIGSAAFSGQAGELRAVVFGGRTVISGDVNGNGTADFAINLDGRYNLEADAFLL